jgi:hypothetical protein
MRAATSRPRRLHTALAAALALLMPAAARAQRPAEITITAINIERVMLGAVITVEADGPLPAPDVGVLDGPPRIFFDLSGVNTKTRRVAAPADDPFVHRVRAALNRVSPKVARVVIDLTAPQPHAVNVDALAQGRLTITVGPIAAPGAAERATTAPPVAAAAPAAAPPVATPTAAPPASAAAPPPTPAAPPPAEKTHAAPAPAPRLPKLPDVHLPAEDVQRYRRDAAAALARIEAFRGILQTIDARVPPGGAPLDLADQEIRAARAALANLTPPPSLMPTHDLLRQSCELAASAVAAARGAAPDSDQSWSAAAAAAGALMLIERAKGNLGIR